MVGFYFGWGSWDNCNKEIHQSGGKVGEGDQMGEGKGGDHGFTYCMTGVPVNI